MGTAAEGSLPPLSQGLNGLTRNGSVAESHDHLFVFSHSENFDFLGENGQHFGESQCNVSQPQVTCRLMKTVSDPDFLGCKEAYHDRGGGERVLLCGLGSFVSV